MATRIIGPKKGGFNPIPAPKGNPPVCTIRPVVTGALATGNLLSCTQGTWLRNPVTYLYQWQRNSVDIPHAVNPTYTAVNADLNQSITCLITAWNLDGPGYSLSLPLSTRVDALDFSSALNSFYLALIEDF